MKYKMIISLLLVFSGYVHAQFDEPMKAFPTPEAASFTIFGKVPVNGFTGVPDISIPLYDFKVRGGSVPIRLSYHTASVKPNLHPGWVGLGWNMLAGGCITRKVNCMPDELKHGDGTENGYLGHYSDLDSDDWTSDDRMGGYLKSLTGLNIHEAVPDEFNFSFCGYSGTFYLDHQGNWQVRSDVDIKVLFDVEADCIKITEIRKNLKMGVNIYPAQPNNDRLINTFTLITPDGTHYVFGGKDATEYTIPYFFQQTAYLTASSWFLTKVRSPEGFEINLTYEPGDPIVELKPFYTYLIDDDRHWSGQLSKGNEACRECLLMFPVYLKKMEMGDSERSVEFVSSRRTDLKVNNDYIAEKALLNLQQHLIVPVKLRNIFYTMDVFDSSREIFVKDIDELKWRKLDRIKIRDGSVQRDIEFSYSYPDKIKGRIRLNSIRDTGQGSYLFSYYDHIDWPEYYTDQDDHWGFLKPGREISWADTTEYFYQKMPSYSIQERTSGILSGITYPTGGKVSFIYENNEYSKYVDKMNVLQLTSDRTTGGIRIKRIVRSKPDGSPDGSLSYFYLNDFNSLADTAAGKPSSGILAKYPYYKTAFHVKFDNEDKFHYYSLFSSGALAPYLINAYGSHIGYSNVIELARDATGKVLGYKITGFTNFDTDIWGESHPNELFICGGKYQDYLLNRLSDKSLERGKILSEKHFTATGFLKKKVLYKYTPTPEKDFVRGLYFNKFYLGEYTKDGEDKDYRMLYTMDAFKYFVYSYMLARKEEYSYGTSTSAYVKTDAYYTYNKYNLLTQESHSAGTMNRIVTSYTYPYDVGDSDAKKLAEYHIQVPLVKQTMLDKAKGGQVFLSKELFDYRFYFETPYLFTYRKAMKNESDLIEYYRCNEIDDRGNPLHVVLQDGMECGYIWSDNLLYPVAELKNITYEDYRRATQEMGNLDAMRKLFPDAQITGFRFTDDGKKIWEENIRKLHTDFKFNSSGWLRFIYDDDSNLLKQYDYEYRLK